MAMWQCTAAIQSHMFTYFSYHFCAKSIELVREKKLCDLKKQDCELGSVNGQNLVE
jgi:hypothetical protein